MRTTVDLVKISLVRVGRYLSFAHMWRRINSWITVTRIKSCKERRYRDVCSLLRDVCLSRASYNPINDKLIHAKHPTMAFFNARNVTWSYAGKFLSALYTNPLYLRKDGAGISLAKSLLRGWDTCTISGKDKQLNFERD